MKIEADRLPKAANLHWLGPKAYADLPGYLSNWTAGWMPFAMNASTRFISPTKTPELLAAGLPLVSTAVPDIVRACGDTGMVSISDAEGMTEALRLACQPRAQSWRDRVEEHLTAVSWDRTWAGMATLIDRARTSASLSQGSRSHS